MEKSIELPINQSRLQSIDTLRGVVMVIMALDHVRDFFSYTAHRATDVTQASVMLFFTRWITHLCAPTFVFLSGISIFLYSKKVMSRKKTVVFLLTRGLWLIAVEIFIISFILTQGYQLTLLEVIWAIGISMILLAALIWLPRWLQIVLSLAMIFGHNALPPIGQVTPGNVFFAFLHNSPFFIDHPPILVAYTIVPWVAVMLLGYSIGPWFLFGPAKRNKLLLAAGVSALVLFIVLRYVNIYGDSFAWSTQPRGGIYTFLSFMNVTKSPPSLLYLSVTLGVAFIMLLLISNCSSSLKNIFITYGRVPFFFFVVHLAVISVASYIWTYTSFGRGVNLSFVSPKEWPAEYRPNLWRAYVVWVLVVVALYYPCRWFARVKSKTKAWWVSYL